MSSGRLAFSLLLLGSAVALLGCDSKRSTVERPPAPTGVTKAAADARGVEIGPGPVIVVAPPKYAPQVPEDPFAKPSPSARPTTKL